MRTIRFILPAGLAAVLACTLAGALAAGPDQALSDDAARRGWHFYREPPDEADDEAAMPPARPPVPDAPRQPPPSSAPVPRAELADFDRLQKQLEETRKVAIMRPTEDNVRRYMDLEAAVVRRASYFADVAQRVAWAHPELDMTLEGRPVNAQAIEVYDRRQLSERADVVKALGQDHVLLFFFRSDCPYCHAFAPTLAEFSARYGISVVAISIDGPGLAEFPQYRMDNGMARRLQVTTVPTVFLAQPGTGQIQPVGFGPLSESQLLERLTVIQQPLSQSMPQPMIQPNPDGRAGLSDLAATGLTERSPR